MRLFESVFDSRSEETVDFAGYRRAVWSPRLCSELTSAARSLS